MGGDSPNRSRATGFSFIEEPHLDRLQVPCSFYNWKRQSDLIQSIQSSHLIILSTLQKYNCCNTLVLGSLNNGILNTVHIRLRLLHSNIDIFEVEK